MKPEEFLIKYGICSDTTIGIEGDKKLTELLEEYAIQALLNHEVVDQSEPEGDYHLAKCYEYHDGQIEWYDKDDFGLRHEVVKWVELE